MNYLVVDFNPERSGQTVSYMPLLKSLESNSGKEWHFSGPGIKNRALHSIERYRKYFAHAWKLFLDRKNISGIVSLQQFYGIIFAGYCMIFNCKKTTQNVIVSFIYKPKSGLIGKIYRILLRKIVLSNYVDKIYVHSQHEVDYYVCQLRCDPARKKFEYLPLGIVDIGGGIRENQGYILSLGNSNRDFRFVEDALMNYDCSVRIYSDEYPQHINRNIICSKSVSGKEYVKLIKNCFCVVLALADENISAGQLTILQTYAIGKPLIITKTKGCAQYIVPPVAISISKSKKELVNAIERLRQDSEYYDLLCKEARKIFISQFSLSSMGKIIGSNFMGKLDSDL